MEQDFIPMGAAASGDAPAVLLNSLRVPWIRRKNTCLRAMPPLVRLHNEILDYAAFISLNASERAARDSALGDIKEVVSELWPRAHCAVFGSGLTGILTPHSDLDIAVLDVPLDAGAAMEAIDSLRRKGLVSYLEVITSARTPIIKADHRFTGLSMDIVVNNDGGLRTGATVRRLAETFPPLRPLTLVLKIFLQQRRLGDTFTGGVGSFVLSCMVVSFLQQRERLAAKLGRRLRYNLGGLLLEFLELYGGSFNYYHVGISISGDGKYYSKQQRQQRLAEAGGPDLEFFNPTRAQPLLSVQNPDEPFVDMGKNTRVLSKIRRAFEHALELLTHALADSRAHNDETFLSYIIRPDDPLLADREQQGEQPPPRAAEQIAEVRPAKRARKVEQRRQRANLEALREEIRELEQELARVAEQRALLDRRRAELDARVRAASGAVDALEEQLADNA